MIGNNMRLTFLARVSAAGFIIWCSTLGAAAQQLAGKSGILLTAFAVNKAVQVQDIDNISHGLPRELARRLDAAQVLNVRTVPGLLSTDWTLEEPTPEFLRRTAAGYASRFIVAGAIVEAGGYVERKFFGLWKTNKRALTVQVWLYEGSSGRLLNSHTFSRVIDGNIEVGRERVFGGAAFMETPFGHATAAIADEISAAIIDDVRGQL